MTKKHGIGISKKDKLKVDAKKQPSSVNTLTLFVDDAPGLAGVDALVSSSTYIWARPQSVSVVAPPAGSSIATIVIKAFCLSRRAKKHSYGDGDDDLTITLYYEDGSGGIETDECTFTDVEYTTTYRTDEIQDRPTPGRK
jgi:hypothetical protein